MERTQVLELMGTLKLYGMRSAYDEGKRSFLCTYSFIVSPVTDDIVSG